MVALHIAAIRTALPIGRKFVSLPQCSQKKVVMMAPPFARLEVPQQINPNSNVIPTN
jgi:hypothetical protein